MSKIVKRVLIRSSVHLDEDEWVEFEMGPRTTFVVVRAVLETYLEDFGQSWAITVYGHHKENPNEGPGRYEQRRQHTYTNELWRGHPMPSALHDLFNQMRKA